MRLPSWGVIGLLLSGPVVAANLFGVVVDRFGNPLSESFVEVRSTEDEFIRRAAGRGDGTFSLLDLNAEDVDLIVNVRGFRTLFIRAHLEESSPVHLILPMEVAQQAGVTIPKQIVTGTVIGEDGQPKAEAKLCVASQFNREPTRLSVTTDSDGRFRVELPAGQFRFTAAANGMIGILYFQVGAEMPSTQLELVLNQYDESPC